MDLNTLFKDVAHEYIETCMTPAQARHLVDRAFRIALAERCVTCIVLPKDVREMDYEDPPRKHGTIHSSAGYRPPRLAPREQDLRSASRGRSTRTYERGDKYAVSIACGERTLLPEVRKARTSTFIVADGFSCREQIAQETDRHALHLARSCRSRSAIGARVLQAIARPSRRSSPSTGARSADHRFAPAWRSLVPPRSSPCCSGAGNGEADEDRGLRDHRRAHIRSLTPRRMSSQFTG